MDYTDFAVGPRGETICSNASGELFYLSDRGAYVPVRREEDVRTGLLGTFDIVTEDEFYDAGNLSIGGYIVDPADCQPVSSVASDMSNDNYIYTPKNAIKSSLKQQNKAESTTTNSIDTTSKGEGVAHTKHPYQVNNTSLNQINNTPLGSAQGISGLDMGLSSRLANEHAFNHLNESDSNSSGADTEANSISNETVSPSKGENDALNNHISSEKSDTSSTNTDTEIDASSTNEIATISKGEGVAHTKHPYQSNNTTLGSTYGVSGLSMKLSNQLANEIAFNLISENASGEDVGAYVTDNFSSALQPTPEENTHLDNTNQNSFDYPSSLETISSSGGGWDFTADSEMQITLSNQLNTAADKFDNKVSMMYREIGNLSSSWVGEDYDAYCNATNGYKTALGDLSDSIRMYGKHFEKMAETTDELSSELIEIVETCTHRHAR